jgi:hypothetical protein
MDRERLLMLVARGMTDDVFDEDERGEFAWWWIYNAIIHGVGNTLNSMTDEELWDKLEDWASFASLKNRNAKRKEA